MKATARLIPPSILALVLLVMITGPAVAAPPDMDLYARARTAHLEGEYEKALPLYEQLKSPGLAEAGACYAAQCLARLGRHQEAIDRYEALLAKQEHQQYRGEARLGLARLQCEQADQPAGYQRALENLNAAVVALTVSKQSSTPDASEDLPSPPSPLLIGPRYVVNAQTADWYAPLLKSRIALLKVYVFTQLDRKDAAEAALEQLRENKTNKRHWIESHTLDRLAMEVERGAFFIPSSTWQSFTSAHAPQLQLAFFYLATRRYLLGPAIVRPSAPADCRGRRATPMTGPPPNWGWRSVPIGRVIVAGRSNVCACLRKRCAAPRWDVWGDCCWRTLMPAGKKPSAMPLAFMATWIPIQRRTVRRLTCNWLICLRRRTTAKRPLVIAWRKRSAERCRTRPRRRLPSRQSAC